MLLGLVLDFISDDAEKSVVSHTVLVCSVQHLHNKSKRANREHWCGASQILFESQVRTFHNSKVLEQGKL